MREELQAVWEGFVSPPDEARPRAWWHWLYGNVDPEGIRLDLEWLHKVARVLPLARREPAQCGIDTDIRSRRKITCMVSVAPARIMRRCFNSGRYRGQKTAETEG